MARHTRAAATEAATRVAGMMRLKDDDAPTDQIPTVPTTPPAELATRNGRRDTNAADATVAGFVTSLAHLAEHDRWASIYRAEVKTLVALGEMAAKMERDIADRSHVDHDLIRQLVALSANWASQVGAIAEDGGS